MRLDTLFLRISVIYIMAGLLLGIGMAASGNHGMMSAHAHINLVGWVGMTIFGLVYRAYPAAAETTLAKAQFWFSNIGAVLLTAGVVGITAGYPESAEPFAIVGSIIFAVGMLLFAIVVYTSVAGSAPATVRSAEPSVATLGAVRPTGT